MPLTLPPLPLEPEATEPVRRKKRRPKPAVEAGEDQSDVREQNREQPTLDSTTTLEADTTAKPRRKKRKPKAETTESNVEGLENTQDETRNDESGLAETKTAVKKRRRKSKPTSRLNETFDFSGELPEEFEGLQDDFIEPNAKPVEAAETDRSNEQLVKPNTNKMSSKRVFVETRSGFTSSGLRKTMAFEDVEENEAENDTFEGATVKAAVWTQKFFHGLGVFMYGLTAGLGVMQAIFVMILIDHSYEEFVKIYENLGLPFLCSFYLLTTLCLVTTLDKWDLEKPRRGYFSTLVRCNAGLWASIAYFLALGLTCVISTYEDKIQLSNNFPNLWYGNYSLTFIKSENGDTYDRNLTETSSVHNFTGDESLDVFSYLVIGRALLLVLGWLYVSIQPQTDELVENLKDMELGYKDEHTKGVAIIS